MEAPNMNCRLQLKGVHQKSPASLFVFGFSTVITKKNDKDWSMKSIEILSSLQFKAAIGCNSNSTFVPNF